MGDASENHRMIELLPGIVCLVVGMAALGVAGAMRMRQAAGGWRWALVGLGAFSGIAGGALIARVGGVGGLVFVSAGLTVFVGACVLIGYFVAMISSVDEALTPRPPPPTPDFQFLEENRAPEQTSAGSAPARFKARMQAAQKRIAKMRFLTGWSFLRKPPE